MNLRDLRGSRLLMAASGGLDSCTITHWLTRHGVEVVACTADLGQPDEEDMEDVRGRMLACGASEMILADLREEIAGAGFELLRCGARYEGGYWNTTAIARHVVVAGLAFDSVAGGRVAQTALGDTPEISRMDLARFEEVSGVDVEDVWIRLRAQSPPQPDGLPEPVPDPDLGEGPHLSYAFQWFFFSAGAVVVYALILRRAAKGLQASADTA